MLFTILFHFGFALVVAGLEVEAEGKSGWAYRMPTWYRTSGWAARVFGLLMGGKPMTGYHCFMFFVPLFYFHAQFAAGVTWTVAAEIQAWAMYFAWVVVWDYLWFVINPHFFHCFNKESVWWHAKSWWVLGLFPFDYLLGIILSIGLTLLAGWMNGQMRDYFFDHLSILLGYAAGVMVVHLLAPSTYHPWYWKMRRHDDRDQIKIIKKMEEENEDTG